MRCHRRLQGWFSADSLVRRCLLARGCMEAEACAHALLPGALFLAACFDLGERGRQGFAAELAHLDVQERRNDRDERHHEDVDEAKKLLIDAVCEGGLLDVDSNLDPSNKKAHDHRDYKLEN